MKIVYPSGATPLSDDDLEGLIPEHLTTQGALNAWEQENLLEGREALARRKPKDLLTDAAIREVHRRLFDRTWRWAGRYRQRDTNIGVDWAQIPERVRVLGDDVRYQRDHDVYGKDELAARFHHRLVAIHPFPNGNGRHARFMADLLLGSLGEEPFSWGSADLNREGGPRDAYLAALRAADQGDYDRLLRFVRR